MPRNLSDNRQFLKTRYSSHFNHTSMKKSFFSLSAILIIALSFTACKKDEKTFEEKVTGDWHSVSVRLNGTDATNYYSLDIQLDQDKTFDAILKVTSVLTNQAGVSKPKGTWSADNGGQSIELMYDDSNETELYEVIDISDTEMTVKIKQGEDKIEIAFERQ